MNTNLEEMEKALREAMAFKDEAEREEFRADAIHLRIMANVKEQMERRGMNRTQLATLLGVSKGYVSQLFSGDTLLNMKTLAKLEAIFGAQFVGYFHSFSYEYKLGQNEIGFGKMVAEPGAEYGLHSPEDQEANQANLTD